MQYNNASKMITRLKFAPYFSRLLHITNKSHAYARISIDEIFFDFPYRNLFVCMLKGIASTSCTQTKTSSYRIVLKELRLSSEIDRVFLSKMGNGTLTLCMILERVRLCLMCAFIFL